MQSPSLANNPPKPPGAFPTPSHLVLFAGITGSRQAVIPLGGRGLLILDPSPAKTLEINERETTSAAPASLVGYKRKIRQFWRYLSAGSASRYRVLGIPLGGVDGRGQPSANPRHAGVNQRQRGLHALEDRRRFSLTWLQSSQSRSWALLFKRKLSDNELQEPEPVGNLDLPGDNVSTGTPSTGDQTSYWVGC